MIATSRYRSLFFLTCSIFISMLILNRKVKGWIQLPSTKPKILPFERDWHQHHAHFRETRFLFASSRKSFNNIGIDGSDDDDDDGGGGGDNGDGDDMNVVDNAEISQLTPFSKIIVDEKSKNTNKEAKEDDVISRVSNLSDLENRVQQQIREKKHKSNSQKKLISNDTDTELKQNFDTNTDGTSQHNLYRTTLEKAHSKLLEIIRSEVAAEPANDGFDSILRGRDDVSNEQRNHQKDKSNNHQRQRLDQSKVDDIVLNTHSEKDDKVYTYESKRLDDTTFAEWEELENRVGKIKKYSRDENGYLGTGNNRGIINEEGVGSTKLVPKIIGIEEGSLDEKSMIPDNLLSAAASISVADDDGSNNSRNYNDDNKYLLESDYEIIDDCVFLSPEAYRQACANTNSDGSLNFGSIAKPLIDQLYYDDNEVGTPRSSNNNEELFLSPSAINASMKAKPMAPYGTKKENITIEDLKKEAARSRSFIENNPDAQEELHRRLLAEEPTYENDESDLFKEVLLDPQKAYDFWNQEYFHKQNEEENALEELLDLKMREMEEGSDIMRTRRENIGEVKSNSKEQLERPDSYLFVAPSAKEIKERQNVIERERLQRAQNVAKYYQDVTGADSIWKESAAAATKHDRKDHEEVILNKGHEQFKPEKKIIDEEVNDDGFERVSETKMNQKEEEWVLIEDPTSEEDPFYWNSVSGEMRWELPSEG